MSRPKGKPGPKPKGPYEDKRKTLTTRITEETRTQLETFAKASGRSLSQEIEMRLERSFRDDAAQTERLYRDFGGRHNYMLAKALAKLANDIEDLSWTSWPDDEYAFSQFRAAVEVFLDALTPPPGTGRTEPSQSSYAGGQDPKSQAALGPKFARGWLDQFVAGQEPLESKEGLHTSDNVRIAHEIGVVLGPLIRREKE